MSILIKGMTRPKNCFECPFTKWVEDDGYAECWADSKVHNASKPVDCPLVEIPEPHGRLIDVDALAQDLEEDVERDQRALDDMDIVGDERTKLQFDKDCKQNCMWYLTESFTVIEAEGSENH